MDVDRRRALVIVLAGLVGAYFPARGALADALIARGDEFARGGSPAEAGRYFRRALLVGGNTADVVDKIAFAAVRTHQRPEVARARAIATGFLAAHPEATVVRLDRALASAALGDSARAAADFRIVGRAWHDRRLLGLAAKLERVRR